VVGGRLHALGTNARLGHGPFMVAEADESDGSFLRLAPALSVITNIDLEHVDHYASLEEIRNAFVYFANRVPFYGVTVLCADDPQVRAILGSVRKRMLLYGTAQDADVRAEDIRLRADGSRFRVVAHGRVQGEVELHQPGHHNVLNALAAVAVGLEVEIGFAHVAEALAAFVGVSRRFELRGEAGGVRVIDDYAHHPTEIRATLTAAAASSGRRLVVFQPHRYSRTQALAEEFGQAFGQADRVWVLDVYGAGEKPIEGVSGRTVADSARRIGATHVCFVPDSETVVAEVASEARSGDTVMTLGAGDVWKLGESILDRLRSAGVQVER